MAWRIDMGPSSKWVDLIWNNLARSGRPRIHKQLELSFALGSRSVHDLFLRIRHVHLQEAARVIMEVLSSPEGFSLDYTKEKRLQQDRCELNFGPPTPGSSTRAPRT